MRKQTKTQWLIIGLFFLITIIKSQTCTNPIIITTNGQFTQLDSFATGNRFFRFTANNFRTRIKFYFRNYSASNNYIKFYNNNCANLQANLLNPPNSNPFNSPILLNVSGDSIEVASTAFIQGNEYLIEIGQTNTPYSYFAYSLSIKGMAPNYIGACGFSTICPVTTTCELVCNGNFENLLSTITNFSDIYKVDGWDAAKGTPDIFTSSAAINDLKVPCNLEGSTPHAATSCTSQNCYAGIANDFGSPFLTQNAEYLETQLTSTLQPGKTYVVSFLVRKAQNGNAVLNKLAAFITSNQISESGSGPVTSVPATRTFSNTGGILNNSSAWSRISFCYTASGGEKYLTIGIPNDPNAVTNTGINVLNVSPCNTFVNSNLASWQGGEHYLYIDDVSMKLVDAQAGSNQTVTPCGNVNLNGTLACGITSILPLTYNWSGPGLNSSNTSTNVNVSTNSTFYFSASMVGDDSIPCTSTSAMSVISNTPVPLTLTPSAYTVCPGSTVSISASGALTYTFLPGGSTSNPTIFTPTANTTYTVSGYTGSCYMTKTITIYTFTNTLSVSSATNNICIGSAVTLTASGGNTYTWSPGGQTTSTVSVSPGSTTTYTVTGLTSPNNCLRSATKTITVNSLPTLTISPSSTNTICLNSSITLTASGASTYTWQSGGIVSPIVTLSPTVNTTYTVSGTSAVGCTNSSTASIVVNPLPSISCSTNKTLVCQGSTSTLSASGASTYTWSPGGLTGSSVVVTSTANPTFYTVTGTSAAGCTNSCVVTQSVYLASTPFITVTATPSVVCNATANATLTATGSTNNYTWMPGSVVGNTLAITAAGTYTAASTTTLGCMSKQSITVAGTDVIASFTTMPVVCGIQSIDLSLYTNPSGAGTYSVNGTQITGSTYTFSSASSTAYTVGFTYTAGIWCNNTATTVLTTNTACCTTTLSQVTSTAISSTTITGGVAINQDITISGYVTFQNGEFLMAPNVKINVTPNSYLILYGAHLYACQNNMWTGIDIQSGGRVLASPSTTTGMSTLIEDAKTAINLQAITLPTYTITPIEVTNSIFNKNYVAVNINTVTINQDLPIIFNNNVVTCRTLTFTSTSWPTTSTVSPGLRAAASATTSIINPYTMSGFTATTCIPPYSGQPSYIGVQLNSVSNGINYGITVGGTNGVSDLPSDFNLFDNLDYGVYALSSNVSVINNVFQNTRQYTGRSGTMGGSAIYYKANNNYLYKLNLTNTVSTYSLSTSVGNRFWDCHRAVEAYNPYRFNMEYNLVRSNQSTSSGTVFTSGNTGVYLNTNRFQYYIRNTEFSNIRNPISIPVVSGTYDLGSGPVTGIYAANMVVANNYIGAQTTTTTSLSGQYVSSAVTISSPNTTSWTAVANTMLSIATNTIDRAYRGISVNTMNSYSTSITNNIISNMQNDVVYSATQRGIELANTSNNVVITTNTLSAANNTNTAITLVYLGNNSGTTSPSVTCNNLNTGYQGFQFDGPNNNTFWRGNLMQAHQRGMVLSNSGVIGTQGSSGSPQDNQWLGTWSGSNYGTYVDGSVAQNSLIWYKSGLALPTPSGNVVSSQWYGALGTLSLTTGTFYCSGGPPPPSGKLAYAGPRVYEVIPNYNTSSFKGMNPLDSISDDDEYLQLNNAYRILDANPDLISGSSSNAAFYNNYSNTSIGKFVQAEKQAYNGSSAQANAISSSVSSKVSVEDNYKTYFDLYDKYKADTFDSTDVVNLITLASKCPGVDGPVIYQARSLYHLVTKDVFVVKDNCEQASNARQTKKQTMSPKATTTWDVQLYPNPTSGELNLVSKNDNESLTVIIKDATGKVVNQNNLQVSNFIGNLTLNLENGLYLISVTNTKNETVTKKLIIAK